MLMLMLMLMLMGFYASDRSPLRLVQPRRRTG
jgi:hypothetical protein